MVGGGGAQQRSWGLAIVGGSSVGGGGVSNLLHPLGGGATAQLGVGNSGGVISWGGGGLQPLRTALLPGAVHRDADGGGNNRVGATGNSAVGGRGQQLGEKLSSSLLSHLEGGFLALEAGKT